MPTFAAHAGRPRGSGPAFLVAMLLGCGLAQAASPPPAAAPPPAAPAPAAPGPAASGAADQEADHTALRRFKPLFEQAINENRLEMMRPYLDQPFSVVTYTDREFTDFDAFQARWQQTRSELLQGGRYTVTLDPDRSDIYGDVAVAHGNSDNLLVTGSGEEHRFSSHWTVVFHKVGGEWKIARAHNSLNPFDNPMLRAGVRRIVTRFAVGALVVGLVLGWVAATLVARRRSRASAPA